LPIGVVAAFLATSSESSSSMRVSDVAGGVKRLMAEWVRLIEGLSVVEPLKRSLKDVHVGEKGSASI
jgi:hypothetical protein